MAIYELRTYTAVVGKMSEVVELYKTRGWPALSKHPARCIGYFTGDVGALNQLIHVWKFNDDADRRAFWAGVYADEHFMEFAKSMRPNLLAQDNKLMLNAPWGPQP
jgi:NIPSNAP